MDQNLCEIVVVQDRSGSMGEVGKASEAVRGFNMLVKEQKEVPGAACMSLIQFDNEYSPRYIARDIREVEDLVLGKTYQPRGMTALLDAVGRAIIETGERLKAVPEEKRPGKVMFVIMTDGLENVSQEFTKERVREMITHQRDKYSWEFVFIGAGVDAFTEASSMGMVYYNQAPIANTAKGIRSSYSIGSASVRAYRTGQNVQHAMNNAQQEAEEDEIA